MNIQFYQITKILEIKKLEKVTDCSNFPAVTEEPNFFNKGWFYQGVYRVK